MDSYLILIYMQYSIIDQNQSKQILLAECFSAPFEDIPKFLEKPLSQQAFYLKKKSNSCR